MDRLGEEEVASVEEHLLVCAGCQDRVTELTAFLRAARQAASEVREEKYRSTAVKPAGSRWHFQAAWAVAAAAAVVLVAVPAMKRPQSMETVELSAYRGAVTGTGVVGAGRPLQLNIDVRGLSETDCCLIDLVDQDGQALASRAVEASGGRVSVDYDRGLGTGRYWVRVKNRAGEELRELELEAR